MSRQWRSDDTSKWRKGFFKGEDGALTIGSNTTFDTGRSISTVSSGGFSVTTTNVEDFPVDAAVLIHQTRGTGAGNWELNIVSANPGGSGSGALTLKYPLQNTYTDSGASQAQMVRLKKYSSVNVSSGFTWSVPAWNGDVGGILAFFCSGTTTIDGTIQGSGNNGSGNSPGSGRGFSGGTGVKNTTSPAFSGEGTTGAPTQQTTANGNGGGGGKANGSDGGGGGGGGGHAASGDSGTIAGSPNGTAGSGGSAAGTAGLTTLVFGGGGGGGGNGHNEAGVDGGGGGGAIVIIFSADLVISSTASITVNGGNGDADHQRGGGGGAGGSVLLKFKTGSLNTNKITAAGGAGGNSGSSADGGNGSVGRIHADYSKTISGTTSPTIDSRQDSSIKESNVANMLLAF